MKDARGAALKILLRIEKDKAWSNIELKNFLAAESIMKPEDRRLLSMLVYGVMRMKRTLDHIIAGMSDTPLRKIDDIILNILRLGVYQLKYMDRIPVSAVCNESVKLAKNNGRRHYSGFVNAILRNLVRNPDKLVVNLPDEKLARHYRGYGEYISKTGIALSFPDWIVEKWFKDYGLDEALRIMEASNSPADITIRVNTLKTDRHSLLAVLEQEGIVAVPGNNSKNSIILKNLGNTGGIENSTAYKKGLFYVQDEASMIAIEKLGPKPGEIIMDLCGAPGGKSTYMAELMNNTGLILSGDLYSSRLKLIEESAERLGIEIIETMEWDAENIDSRYYETADRVLADVPCSGLGVIRRKPEIKWNTSRDDIASLKKIQKNILKSAALCLKKGGMLMYSTCTLSGDENESVISGFLIENSGFSLIMQNTLFPHINATDGFYYAILTKDRDE